MKILMIILILAALAIPAIILGAFGAPLWAIALFYLWPRGSSQTVNRNESSRP